MITVTNLVKRFDNFTALNDLTMKIDKGCVYGLVGSNGAGKSTLLRLITGVYKADKGEIKVDGMDVYDNPDAKAKMVFVADELFFLPQSSMNRMARLYSASYPQFDWNRFRELAAVFGLDTKANIGTFSKGMRRQAATILALSCKAEYMFLDETFDGLDPVMRNLVKKVIYNDVAERGVTAIITSHSLRELEDTCDRLALLHSGGIVLESDIENLQTMLLKVQVAFSEEYDISRFEGINILDFNKKGSVANMIVRGDREEVQQKIFAMCPLLCEILPLTLEEVFIYELEAKGYAFDELLIGSDDVM